MRFHLATPSDYPGTDLDYPWDKPLLQWPKDLLVEVPRGISRNIVRFVEHNGQIYALKELPDWIAEKEYLLLRELQDRNMPCVEPVALITERGSKDEPVMAMLITRFLDYAQPFRRMLSGKTLHVDKDKLLDAIVSLIVRLHSAGFYWGDCSLSNALFRRDAGRLAAYLVDAETGELHQELSEGQRRYDLEVAELNMAGELMYTAAENGLPRGIDPVDTANELVHRYERLWEELTRNEIFGRDERFRVTARIKRLNDLGFDVEELEITTVDGGHRMSMRPKVVESGHHQRQLHSLTGIVAQANQSREILNDIYRYKGWLETERKKTMSLAVAAHQWYMEIYQNILDQVPDEAEEKLDQPELFHQILEHRWYMSESAKMDIGTDEAVKDYIANILPKLPTPEVSDGSIAPSSDQMAAFLELERGLRSHEEESS
jgi:hypothetical protein